MVLCCMVHGMKHILNTAFFRDIRKELRNKATPQERILWLHLRKSKMGCKLRRQQSVGTFVVDFYCKEKRLIIEIDGFQHKEQKAKEYDILRTEYLNSVGFKVLRFWNSEIDVDIERVLRDITKEIKKKG